MHKKLLILYAITNTMCYINITAESDAQKAWTAYKKHTQDQQQQDPFYQLKEAAYDVALDSKQQQLLAACLYRNCNACFKLKNEIQEKLKKDTTTLRDAADNGKKL